MSFALSNANAPEIKNFCARNGNNVVSSDAAACWAGFLAANGGTGVRLPELEATWLASNGAAGSNLRDLWGNYLAASGYTGNIRDMMRVYMTSGTVGATVFSDRLTEDNSFRIQESGIGNTRLLEG